MEVNSVRASNSKVTSCHFSSDGKLLASGGHDKKVSSKRRDELLHASKLSVFVSLIMVRSEIIYIFFPPCNTGCNMVRRHFEAKVYS